MDNLTAEKIKGNEDQELATADVESPRPAPERKWYIGAMNDAYHVIDQPPQPGPIDYFCSMDHVDVIVSCGTDRRLAELLVAEHNARLPLDCAMCNAPNSFVISPLDPAVGYCFKEQQAWRVNLPFCDFCGKCVPVRYCDLCKVYYCNEGEDDDRFCAIEHENKHENTEASERRIDEWLVDPLGGGGGTNKC